MIPKDEHSSGHNDDECYAKLYGKTKEDVDAKRKDYFASYPVMGYNTRTAHEGWRVDTETEIKYYYILIRRWHSCD